MGVDERLHQLLHEERISLRPTVEHGREVTYGVAIDPERPAHELGHLLTGQRIEREDARRPERVEGPLGADEVRIAVPLLVVVGAEQEQRRPDRLPREEVDELEARLVGPLKVFEDAEDRLTVRVPLHELREVPHEAGPELLRVLGAQGVASILSRPEGGKEVLELPLASAREDGQPARLHLLHDRKPCVGEERVRDARLDRIRPPFRHPPVPALGAIRQLGHQARLPYSSVPAHEDDRGAVLTGQHGLELGELVRAPDEREWIGDVLSVAAVTLWVRHRSQT